MPHGEDGAVSRARVLSVNVGGVREAVWRGTLIQTAIWKSSVGNRAVRVEGVNLEGDDQADRQVHGGPDKAVYAYAIEDYSHWWTTDGIVVEPGRFGENLTTEGLDLRTAVIGERWQVGTALLEVAQPRLPCFKLGARMEDARFPKRFLAMGRLGAYLRIVQPGIVRAHDDIQVQRQPTRGVTLRETIAALTDASLAPWVLSAAALAPSWREMIRTRHSAAL